MELNKNTDLYNSRIEWAERIYNSDSLLPYRYSLVLTNKCNLSCSFCFQDRKKRDRALTLDNWIDFLSQLPDYAHLTLSGGEPLSFKGFDEFFLAADKRFTTNIITNGTLFNEKNIDMFANSKNLQILSTSIDDIGNIVRGVKPAQWEKMKKMFDLLKSKNSKIIIDAKTVVLDENAKDLFSIYRHFKETLGIDTHSFQFLKGSPVQHADFPFKLEAIYKDFLAYDYKEFDIIIEQLENIRKYNLKNNFRSYTHPSFVDLNTEQSVYDQGYKLYNQIKHNPKSYKPCIAPWASMHINTDGDVYPCLALKMGNIHDNTLREIFFGEEFESFKNDLKSKGTFPSCGRCGYLRLK